MTGEEVRGRAYYLDSNSNKKSRKPVGHGVPGDVWGTFGARAGGAGGTAPPHDALGRLVGCRRTECIAWALHGRCAEVCGGVLVGRWAVRSPVGSPADGGLSLCIVLVCFISVASKGSDSKPAVLVFRLVCCATRYAAPMVVALGTPCWSRSSLLLLISLLLIPSSLGCALALLVLLISFSFSFSPFCFRRLQAMTLVISALLVALLPAAAGALEVTATVQDQVIHNVSHL